MATIEDAKKMKVQVCAVSESSAALDHTPSWACL